MRKENIEMLLKEAERLGFSDHIKDQILKNMNEGLNEFTASESHRIGNHLTSYMLHFELRVPDNPSSLVRLNETEVLLEKPLEIKHIHNDLINTRVIENLLMPVDNDGFGPEMAHERELFRQERLVQAEHSLEKLMYKHPDIFNALVVKYKPSLDFAIPGHLQQEQQKLRDSLVQYNSFDSEFNLKASEMYNLMCGRAVLRNQTWLKVDFDTFFHDGTMGMKFISNNNNSFEDLSIDYSFDEFSNPITLGRIATLLEEGSLVKVTNLNSAGERSLLIEADPEKEGIKLYTITGEPITDHSLYKRPQYSIVAGEFVEIIKSTGLIQGPVYKNALIAEQASHGIEQFGKHKNLGIENHYLKKMGKPVDSIETKSPIAFRGRKNSRIIMDRNMGNGIRS